MVVKKIYTNTKERFLVYHKQVNTKNKAPYVVFLHGLMSDMNGQKAIATEKLCIERGYNFIKFDNFGHGLSSGKFTDQTISDWLLGINLIIKEIEDAPILLVGSSM
jgi:pimeloyl-ACP methyl ester carboxylesterase